MVEWVQEDAENWRVDLDLWAEDGRTVLRFVQVFAAGADVTDMALGWHWYLDKLGAEIDGGTAARGLGRLRRRGRAGLPAGLIPVAEDAHRGRAEPEADDDHRRLDRVRDRRAVRRARPSRSIR